ncbi:MAG TPA: fumarylacetoacetate hydrolase family protein [Micromonosporaceae bacterium]
MRESHPGPHLIEAAQRLRDAASSGTPCAPVRDLIGDHDVRTAYRVQRMNLDLAGGADNPRVGRKIGLTNPAVQKQLRVDQPDFGSLLADMQVAPGGTVPTGRLLQPKVEGEVAFRLAEDLDAPDITLADLAAAVGGVRAAIEIVDSRIAGWDISIADTVADNASSGMFVVSEGEHSLEQVAPVSVRMGLTVNGEVRSTGVGSACLGDPMLSLLWLARTALEYGDPLRAGEIILSGALGPMVDVRPGDQVSVQISDLGSLHVEFANHTG